MPRIAFSPEENARLLSVYMRPWTLHNEDATDDNPRLADLVTCYLIDGREHTRNQTEEPRESTLACDGGDRPAPTRKRIVEGTNRMATQYFLILHTGMH